VRFGEGTMILSARPHHKLSYAPGRIWFSVRILWSKSFVVVIVAVQDYVGIRFLERLKEWLNLEVVAVFPAGTEQRLVEVSERAGV